MNPVIQISLPCVQHTITPPTTTYSKLTPATKQTCPPPSLLPPPPSPPSSPPPPDPPSPPSSPGDSGDESSEYDPLDWYLGGAWAWLKQDRVISVYVPDALWNTASCDEAPHLKPYDSIPSEDDLPHGWYDATVVLAPSYLEGHESYGHYEGEWTFQIEFHSPLFFSVSYGGRNGSVLMYLPLIAIELHTIPESDHTKGSFL